VKLEEICSLIEELLVIDIKRKRIRKKLLSFLRKNYIETFQNDSDLNLLKRKITNNYLGDLSDNQVCYYSKKTYDKLVGG